MADVYLAKLTGKADFAKLAVVKRLKALEDEDPDIIRMFADEARLCARLNHASIVQTFEVGEDTSGPFLVMEYVEGQPLGRIRSRASRREVTIPRAIGLQILCDTIGALAYAHSLADHDGTLLKVVHRDVSPENIMVTYAGTTKLVDFGVAKTAASLSHTRAGVLKGKVAYMAPEQARSDANIDGRADIFSAGLILWELLTNKRHWEGFNERSVFERLLDKDPLPHTRSVDPAIPEDLDAICAKAMQKEKEDRYANAGDFLEALESACAKHNLRASARDIGQFVVSLFENEREKVKTLVTEAMKTKGDESTGSSLPHANRTSLDPNAPKLEESDPLLWKGLSSGTLSAPLLMSTRSEGSSMPAETPGGVVEARPSQAAPPTSPTNLRLIGAGIAALLVVGGAIIIGMRLAPGTPVPPPVTTPATAVTPPPPPPAPEVPVEIAVDISVKPTTAKISIDGKAVAGNPFHLKVARSDGSHEIRAEAEGYETRSMVVAFDRDRALDMNLVKSAPVAVVMTPPPTPPPPPPPVVSRVTPTPTPHPTTHAPTTPSSPRGISEIDPTKPKTGTKQDKIDTDVFKR